MGVYEVSSNFYHYIHLPIQFLVFVFSFGILSGKKLSFKTIVKSILFLFIPAFLLYVIVYWLGIIFLYIALIVLFAQRFSKWRTILYITAIFIIAIIADHAATLSLAPLEFPNLVTLLIVRNILFMAIHFILLFMFKLNLRVFETKLEFSSKIRFTFISLLVMTLIVFYYNIFLVFDEMDILKVKINFAVFFFYFFLLIVLMLLIFYILLKEEDIRTKEFENKYFSEYIESLEETNNKMQKFQHDYLNILVSLKGYIDSADWEGLKHYFEKEILHFERKTILENKSFGNLKNVHVMSLKGLLLFKSLHAIDQNLNISIEVAEPIDDVYVDTIDLNRVLGNFIDNAIENCIEDGKQNIQIAIVKQDHSILFRISNEIGDKDINISQIFQPGYSTKPYGQGIGLHNVNQIVEKNPKMSLNVWVENGWFNAELIVLGEEVN